MNPSVNPVAAAAPRSRTARSLLAASALLAFAAGSGVAAMASAHAESGRRICEYSFKAQPENTDPDNPRQKNPLLHISLAMDYKKDGACPSLDPARIASTGYVDAGQVNPKNPVNKWTCEDWGSTHQTYLTDLGSDPCAKMDDDVIYAFIWQDPTTPNAAAPSYRELGNWRVYW